MAGPRVCPLQGDASPHRQVLGYSPPHSPHLRASGSGPGSPVRLASCRHASPRAGACPPASAHAVPCGGKRSSPVPSVTFACQASVQTRLRPGSHGPSERGATCTFSGWHGARSLPRCTGMIRARPVFPGAVVASARGRRLTFAFPPFTPDAGAERAPGKRCAPSRVGRWGGHAAEDARASWVSHASVPSTEARPPHPRRAEAGALGRGVARCWPRRSPRG